jgi:hypothetical protein
LRGHSAHHAGAESSRCDAEAHVEATAHVLQRDKVGQLNQLSVVEVFAQLAEEIIGHLDRRAAHGHRVVEHELVQIAEQRTGLVRRKRQQLVVTETPTPGDLRAQVDAVLAVGQGGCLQLGQGLEPLIEAAQLGRGLLESAVCAQKGVSALQALRSALTTSSSAVV